MAISSLFRPLTARALPWQQIKTTSFALFALVIIGLGLRLWFLAVNQIDPRFSAADDGDYYQRALHLAVTGEYRDNSWLVRPPGHIFFFAAMIRLGLLAGDPAIGIGLIRAVQIGLSLALIPLGYDLARRLFDRRAGLIFATIMAIWMPMVELPILILSEPLFFSMLLIHSWMLVRWRDSQRLAWLAGAGFALGVASLARSPGLYGSLFAVAFIVVTVWQAQVRQRWRRIVTALLVFLLPFVAAIAPWTIRNYIVYRDLIIVDSLGPVNLWLAMYDTVEEGYGEGRAKAVLLGLPQEERQSFVKAELQRLLQTDPWRLTRNLWPHFQHIWKAQFLEDFFVKASFFTRPLREIWPLGALSDLIWMATTIAAPLSLLGRPREGAFRLLAIGWIAYTCVMVMLIHVEPRYLLPIWLWMALYGAAALARLRWPRQRPDRFHLAGAAVSLAILSLIVTYRDYPQIIRQGIAREQALIAARQADARGDQIEAERSYRALLAVAPTFTDGRTEFARWLLARGRYDEAWQVIGSYQTHRGDLVRGALARAQGDDETAAVYLRDSEQRAGEDIQRLAFAWLSPAPVTSLTLGNDLDLGYITGFALGERAGNETFRWLQGSGRIRLPLPAPLYGNETLALRLAAPDLTPLTIRVNGYTYRVSVASGGWRVYHLLLPESMRGAQTLDIEVSAPTFLPYQRIADNTDARPVSVMFQRLTIR